MSARNVYEILQDYFGEDRVGNYCIHTHTAIHEFKDVNNSQGCPYSFLVYFPKVTITNENDLSEELTNLFMKIDVTEDGRCLSIHMTRTEFTQAQIQANYAHSHISGIPNPGEFYSPCLGHGPLVSTTRSLLVVYSEDLWRLFCLELDKYMQVESLEGIPYKRISDVKTKKGKYVPVRDYHPYRNVDQNVPMFAIPKVVKELAEMNLLRFGFKNGTYVLTNRIDELLLQVTSIIRKYEEAPSMYIKGILSGDTLYIENKDYSEAFQAIHEGEHCLTFLDKGYDFTIQKTDVEITENCTQLVLRPEIFYKIYHYITNLVNYSYGVSECYHTRNEGNTYTCPKKKQLFIPLSRV